MLVYIFLFVYNIITIPFYLRNAKVYLIINIIPLWILMAFRGVTVGSDTKAYYDVFNQANITQIPMHFVNWLAPVHDARFENGFLLLNKIVFGISPDFRAMLVVTTTIMLSCLVFFIVKLKVNYVIGFLTYESLFMPFFMNAMRQALAISLCMVAFVFLLKNRIGCFCLFNFLAITMHVTAWMFLLTLIYKYVKYGWKSNTLLITFTIVVSLCFERIYGKISTISDEAKTFSNSVATNNLNGSLNVIYSVLFTFLLYIIIIHYIQVLETKGEGLILLNNTKLLLLTAIAFFIVSLQFSQIARIAKYFTIGYFPALSLVAENFSFKKNRNIIFTVVCTYLIVYFIFIQMFRPEWSGIVPYYFN